MTRSTIFDDFVLSHSFDSFLDHVQALAEASDRERADVVLATSTSSFSSRSSRVFYLLPTYITSVLMLMPPLVMFMLAVS